MNLIDGYVLEILEEPKKHTFDIEGIPFEHWGLSVKYEDMGGEHITELVFKTIEDANDIKVGYRFLH